MTATGTVTYDSAEALAPEARTALRRLLLAVADTKLLLGYHYGEWTFGAPELEASVAHCSLGQSELGHVRLLHGLLLSQYGDDPDTLVDARPAEAFASVTYLDEPIPDWPGVVAMTWVVDMAMTRLLHSMRASSFTPVRVSVEKILHEERYHAHHGQGWFRTLAGRDAESRAAIEAAGRWSPPA